MENVRPAKCKGCGKDLLPGEGRRWRSQPPAWAKPGAGFLCFECLDLWGTWSALVPALEREFAYVRWFLLVEVPGEGVPVMQAGIPTVVDCRAILQGEARRAILEDTGLAAAAVARNLAQFFRDMAPAERGLDRMMNIIWDIRMVTMDRMNKTIRVGGYNG